MKTKLYPNETDIKDLKIKSIISEGLSDQKYNIRPVKTQRGGTAHVASVSNVLYHPTYRLQIVEGKCVPVEGIVDPWNLDWSKERNKGRLIQASEVEFVDAEVCIIANIFSGNFSHFTEEVLKIIILEKAGFSGAFVCSNLPKFAIQSLDALGIDRRRLMEAPDDPVIYRSAVYTSHLFFDNLTGCVDVFFELRERMIAAAATITTSYGERLWLERGSSNARKGELVNSDVVDTYIDDYGFTRLDIGSLSLLEQIAAAFSADVIAGPHGSAFLHTMYMKPESTVIEIFSPSYLNGYSWEICRLLRHRYMMIVERNAPHVPYPYGQEVYVNLPQLRLAFESLKH